MKEYSVITFKSDRVNGKTYALSYYWENNERKCDKEEITDKFFYSDTNIIWDSEKFDTNEEYYNVFGNKVNKIVPKFDIKYDDYKQISDNIKGFVFETDVKPLDRHLWQNTPKFTRNIRKWYIDIEILRDDKGQYCSPDVATNKIASITFYDSFNKKYYVLLLTDKKDSIKKDDRYVYTFTDEVKMLEAFLKSVEQLQPDYFTGWNVVGFDMPYLIKRLEILGLDNRRLSPIWSVKLDTKMFKNNISFNITIKGRGIIDLMEIAKQFWMGTDVGYSLEAQSQKWLGEGKIKIGDIDKAYKNDFWHFVEYNVKDVELCVKLDEKKRLITDMQEFQDLISINLFDTPIAGRIINSYIKQHTDIVLGDSYVKEEFDLPGGYVHPVSKGIFKNVHKFDFASHYPAIIRSYNISNDTIVNDPTEEEKKDLIHFSCYYRYVDEEGTKGYQIVLDDEKRKENDLFFEVWFKKDFRGSITKVVDILTEERLKMKRSGNKSRSTVLKRMINCFSGDHDVLTPKGIKNIKDFKIGDPVYTLNPETQKAELDNVIRVYEYDYKGDMYKFENRGVDWIVTPNHRIFYKKHYKRKTRGKLFWEEASDIYNRGKLNLPDICPMPDNRSSNNIDLFDYIDNKKIEEHIDGIKHIKTSFYHSKNTYKSIPRYFNKEDFMKLLGIYISEGCLHYIKNSNSFIITLSQSMKVNSENCKKIEEFLNNMKLEWKNYTTKEYKICSRLLYKFLEEYCGKGSYNKKIPSFVWEFDNKYLKVLYDYLMMGDGDKSGFRYSTVSKTLAKDFLYLCLRLGINAKMYYQTDCKCKTYRIRIRDGLVNSISKKDRQIIDYAGKVYCIECEKNHIIMAGRNNKLKWISQSIYGQYSYKYSRFFNDKCAMAITLIGQYLTKNIIKRIEMLKQGKAVMGDTDSFAIDLYNTSKSDILQTAKEVFDKSFIEHNLPKIYSELELEAIIDKMILFGVKKKYAQLIGKDTKIQGLEMIRRDFPEALKDFQRIMIKRIFDNENTTLTDLKSIRKQIESKIRDSINSKEYMYIAMPTVIKKPIDEYDSNTMEKKALKNSGLKISTNEMFYIIHCQINKPIAFKNIEELEKLQFKIDYDVTIDKIFGNISIFEDLFIKQQTLFNYGG
jgi:DNA polymerase I